MLADLRHAWRALRRAPAYLLAAVLTLALGVGATTALFGVVDAVLLRALPYAEPSRLVRVWPTNTTPDALYELLRARSGAYAALAAYTEPADVSVVVGVEPARVAAAALTGDLLATLGVRPALGRPLAPDDGRAGAAPVAVVSDAFWRERLGGDPRAVGRLVAVDGVAHRVVGVMAPGFALPSAGVALWTAARIDPTDGAAHWWNWRLHLVGRLRPGVTVAQAAAESRALVVRAGQEAFPMRMNADFGADLTVLPFQEALVGGARAPLLLLFAAVGVVLLVAVVNVTGLALVRAAGRVREVTVRAAIGATRARLARQLLAEGVVVAALAAALGAALAWGLTRAVVAALPRAGAGVVPRAEAIGVDGRALAFAVLVALAAGVAAAFVPALAAARVDLRGALADGARGAGEGRRRRRTLEALVAAQVALGVVLAAGAGLLGTSLARLRAVPPGFRTAQVTVAEVPPPAGGRAGDRDARTRQFYDALVARARALPGVDAAALASTVPFDNRGLGGVFDLEAHPRPVGDDWKAVDYAAVSPGALGVLGVPLLAGRDVADADREGAPLVALVDVTAARRYWPELRDVRAVLGQRVRRPAPGSPWLTVVGVVGAVLRDSLDGAPDPTLYLPVAQDFVGELRVVTRGPAGPAALAPALRHAVRALDPTVPVGAVRPFGALVDGSAARARFVARLLVAFAGLAVLLAAVGVYGVVAFATARRTRELGVRVALGATPAAVRALVLGAGARLAMVGAAAGLVGAVAAGRLVRGFLYGVSPGDPWVLAGAAALVGAVTLGATLLPARRAARVNPLAALRAE